jgi:serine/threonine protein kinase
MIKKFSLIYYFTSIFCIKQIIAGGNNKTNLCIRNKFQTEETHLGPSTTPVMEESTLEDYTNSSALQSEYMKSNCQKISSEDFGNIYGTQAEILGTGTFGTVSKFCKNNSTSKNALKCVAVKEFGNFNQNMTLLIAFKEFNNSICIRTFLQEKDLKHFGLISDCYQITDPQNQKNVFRFIMKFYKTDLNQVLLARQGSFEDLPLSKQNDFIYQMLILADNIKTMHRYGISHTDIKPQNIFVDKFDQMKLGDFGTSSSNCDLDQGVAGSPFYMDPELINRDPWANSRRADIYALGVLYSTIFMGSDYKSQIRAILSKGDFYTKIKELESDLKYTPDISQFYFPEDFQWMRTMLQSGIRRMSLKKVIGRLKEYLRKESYQPKEIPVQVKKSLKIKFNSNDSKAIYIPFVDLKKFSKDDDFVNHPLNKTKMKESKVLTKNKLLKQKTFGLNQGKGMVVKHRFNRDNNLRNNTGQKLILKKLTQVPRKKLKPLIVVNQILSTKEDPNPKFNLVSLKNLKTPFINQKNNSIVNVEHNDMLII